MATATVLAMATATATGPYCLPCDPRLLNHTMHPSEPRDAADYIARFRASHHSHELHTTAFPIEEVQVGSTMSLDDLLFDYGAVRGSMSSQRPLVLRGAAKVAALASYMSVATMSRVWPNASTSGFSYPRHCPYEPTAAGWEHCLSCFPKNGMTNWPMNQRLERVLHTFNVSNRTHDPACILLLNPASKRQLARQHPLLRRSPGRKDSHARLQLFDSHVWIHAAGSKTKLHHDWAHNVYSLAWGRKRWDVFPPDSASFLRPCRGKVWGVVSGIDDAAVADTPFSWTDTEKAVPGFKHQAHRFSAVLEAGDALFLPAFWWHRVETMEDSLAVNVWVTDDNNHTDPNFYSLRHAWEGILETPASQRWAVRKKAKLTQCAAPLFAQQQFEAPGFGFQDFACEL